MLRLFLSSLLLICFPQFAFSGETVYAKEIESYMYADGKMKHSKGQFEITYFLEGDIIT